MNTSGILVVAGAVAMLFLIASIIRLFNDSKSILGWVAFLCEKVGVGLAFLLFIDIQLIILMFSIILVWMLAYKTLSWGHENLTPEWQYILIALAFIYYVSLIWLTGSKLFYSWFVPRDEAISDQPKSYKSTLMRRVMKISFMRNISKIINFILSEGVGFLIPLMVIVGLVMLGATCFSSLTTVLHHGEYIAFSSSDRIVDIGNITDFYLWHFCELIPQIEMTKTLNWDVPFTYSDKGIGWLLLSFKILMVTVIIARFAKWYNWRKELKGADIES